MAKTGERILLTGGGTLGSVTPLLAIVPELQRKGFEVLFVGTPKGPERVVVEQQGIEFIPLSAPRLRRFFSISNLWAPFHLLWAMVRAAKIVAGTQPKVIVSAGSFVSVPLVWVGYAIGVKVYIHQQDVQPGLANRLMKRCAHMITVSFEDSLKDFPKSERITWIGNPVRDLVPTTHTFQLDKSVPTVLIFGGGTGAQAINTVVSVELCDFANVIHITGTGKTAKAIDHPRYHRYELLLEEMKEALHASSVVVGRAGLSTISELAALGKSSIIIPIPRTHQEKNAELLERRQAAVVLKQAGLSPQQFTQAIRSLLQDTQKQAQLRTNISALCVPDARRKMIEVILSLMK